jgi:hypothetical protein
MPAGDLGDMAGKGLTREDRNQMRAERTLSGEFAQKRRFDAIEIIAAEAINADPHHRRAGPVGGAAGGEQHECKESSHHFSSGGQADDDVMIIQCPMSAASGSANI